MRLLDTLAVCYRGRRITSEGSESHRPRGAMTGAEGAVDVRFGSLADISQHIRDVRVTLKSGHCSGPQSMSATCHKRTYSLAASVPKQPSCDVSATCFRLLLSGGT